MLTKHNVLIRHAWLFFTYYYYYDHGYSTHFAVLGYCRRPLGETLHPGIWKLEKK